MHHAVHVSRSSPYTSLGKQDTLGLNPLSKSISDDIRGSDASIYAEDSAYVNARFFFWCGRTAVLPKIPHSNSCKRVPNRPLRPRRGRFGTILQQLECGIFGRTAVWPDVLRVVGVVRNSSSRTSMVVHSCEFCLALADPLAHVPSYVSSWRHWRGADAPSLLAEFYAATRNHHCCTSR